MLKVASDVNIEGHVGILVELVLNSEWLEFWNDLDVELCSFADLGLAGNANDRLVWNTVQSHGVVLITGNRNHDGPDSLQATIDDSNTIFSLPVITISNAERFRRNRVYADRVAVKLIEYLLDIEKHRGTGRLYIP